MSETPNEQELPVPDDADALPDPYDDATWDGQQDDDAVEDSS